MFRGSQAGITGRHRGLAPCGSKVQEIPPQLHQKTKNGLTERSALFVFVKWESNSKEYEEKDFLRL
jgi:hypothetical protein